MKNLFRKSLVVALGGLMLFNAPVEVQAAPKKILVITQSAGFRHQPVNRAGKETCQVERVLAEIGKKSGVFTTVNSQNAIKSITRENLRTNVASKCPTTLPQVDRRFKPRNLDRGALP